MKKIILFGVIAVLALTSCDSFLDINQDPNSPTADKLTSSILFPGVEMNLASSYGNYLRITGGYFAQHYAHDFGTSNYVDYSQFIMSATRSSSTYTQLNTRVLYNLETIRTLASKESDWGTYLAATTLRAFTYQALVDAYGEAPYTEALKSLNNSTPHYDDGQTIYDGILEELNVALSKVTSNSKVCTNFLFGTTTVEEWVEFANALKLRILMRESNVKNVQAELANLIAENNFPTKDISFDDCWKDEPGKASPYYQEEYASYFGSTQVNVVANIAFMQTMLSSSDTARVAYAFETNKKGEYTGGVSGTNFSLSTKYKADYFCRPVFKYDMPVFLITVAETEFFLAEYFARYGTAVEAENHYKEAIKASFATVGGTDEQAAGIYNTYYPYDNANYKRLIGIQKWVALGCVNNFEAWCELRRLGYPAFGTVTGDNLTNEKDSYTPTLYVPGTLYTPIKVNSELGSNKLLQRFKYAEASTSRNSNAPATKTGDVPVFWVVNN
ncbi:MAG: SusD/RagB family nutrient-binding outer membrane lipoprotein [Paludibacter sp.]|nr:SusD/RagB family nutrient-binding outer membrane lipoprotein [Paludibacter sp.]